MFPHAVGDVDGWLPPYGEGLPWSDPTMFKVAPRYGIVSPFYYFQLELWALIKNIFLWISFLVCGVFPVQGGFLVFGGCG